MRLLFIGETWQGSSARSLRDAISQQAHVTLSDIGEDHYLPRHTGLPLRIANKLLRPLQIRALARAVRSSLLQDSPDAVMVYKGSGITARLIEEIQRAKTPVINVYPDYSPHSYGRQLRAAVGQYDLVISTKPFHPRLWSDVYGYRNPCVCVPHGYDPAVHFWAGPSASDVYDVVLCANWRPEYQRLMCSFAAALPDTKISVAIAGPNWAAGRSALPRHWNFIGPRTGRAYGEFLRSGKIAIAPVNREVVIRGATQPGDEDTTRTYELASAHCFFLHQRTDYVATVYDERREVPLWKDADELTDLVRRWLPDEAGRRSMAAAAHVRAVPAYSIPQRSVAVIEHVERVVAAYRARFSKT